MKPIYRRLQPPRYILSVLICSLPKRLDTLYDLTLELKKQTFQKPVQVLYLGDNKSITVGEKRNLLLDMSKGEYILFIDDDDMISKTYIDDILEAIKTTPDVITFNWIQYTNGKEEIPYTFKKTERGYRTEINGQKRKVYPINHLCVWRKEIIKERFPHINLSEDWKWAKKMLPHYNKIHHIDKILYTYNFNTELSETRR